MVECKIYIGKKCMHNTMFLLCFMWLHNFPPGYQAEGGSQLVILILQVFGEVYIWCVFTCPCETAISLTIEPALEILSEWVLVVWRISDCISGHPRSCLLLSATASASVRPLNLWKVLVIAPTVAKDLMVAVEVEW